MAPTESSATDGILDPQRALVELGRCTLGASADEELWRHVVEILRQPLQVDCVSALRCSGDQVGLEMLAGAGVSKSLLGTRVADIGTGTWLDTVLKQDEPLVVDDVQTEERFLPSPVALHHKCKSGMVVSVSYDDRIWGVCEFYWLESNKVCDEHIEFVTNAVRLLRAALKRIERDQRRAAKARISEHNYQRFYWLVEIASNSIGMSDLDGKITYLNPSGCQLLGVPIEDALGRSVDEFLPEAESRRFFEDILPQVKAEGRWEGLLEIASLDAPLIHKTDASVFLLSDPQSGAPAGYATVLRDVSEERRLQEQLRQSQKLEALGLLAGGVAHDFNNHLTVIKGYSELLLSGMPVDDDRRCQLEKIHQVSEKARLLADQLLAFSRRKVREPRVVDLNETLVGLKDMLRSLIGEHIVLECLVPDEPSFVQIDPSDLEQVILNLAVNARDAIESKGSITLEVRTPRPGEMDSLERGGELGEDAVVLEVTDTGKGMSDEVLERVFEPFFTTKDVLKGTGLGLATVYRIVTDAEGDITLASQPGCGTSFRLFFPRAEVPVDQEIGADLEVSELEGDEVIMVVEDDPDVLEFITDVLHRYGYDTIPSTDGEEAIDLLENYHDSIDAVICDVVLPHVSTEELRTELVERFSDVPFLMTSGYADNEQFMGDEMLRNLPFVAKPMSPSDLLTELRAVLDR